MEVYIVRKRFVIPVGEDDDDYKVIEESRSFATYSEAFKQFNEYRGELADEIEEEELEDYIKDDDVLSATTISGKELAVWIAEQTIN